MKTNKSSQNAPDLFINSYKFALKMVELGFNVFLCNKDKTPACKGSWKENKLEYDEIQEIQNNHPNRYLFGIPCDQGFSFYDVDTYNPEFQKSNKAKRIFEILKAECKVYQRTQNGGYHFLVRGNLKNTTSKIAPGIDTKGPGGYGILYKWPFIGLNPNDKDEFLSILTKLEDIEYKLGYNKPKDIWLEGQRDIEFFKAMSRAIDDGDKEGLEKAIDKAKRSGLPQSQIDYKIKHYDKKRGLPKSGLNIEQPSDPTPEQSTGISTTRSSKKKRNKEVLYMDIKMAEEIVFLTYLYPKGEVIILSGEADIGKTRSLLSHLSLYKDIEIVLITSENPTKTMLAPILTYLNMENRTALYNPENLAPNHNQDEMIMIKEYLENFEDFIIHHKNKFHIFFVDPTPKFVTWNREKSEKLIEGYQLLARKYNRTIILTRNDGKSDDIKDKYKPKGSSTAFTDTPRVIVRVVECKPGSILEKECGNKEAIVVYHSKNNLDQKRGILFKKEVASDHIKKGINVAYFVKERELEIKEIKKINALCGGISEGTVPEQIKSFIKEYNQRENTGPKYEDLYDAINKEEGTIRSAVKRLKERTEIIEINKRFYISS